MEYLYAHLELLALVMWNPISQPGIKPGSPAWECGVSAAGHRQELPGAIFNKSELKQFLEILQMITGITEIWVRNDGFRDLPLSK